MIKTYEIVIEERSEIVALVVADSAKRAKELAEQGNYDLLLETATTLPNRIKKVTKINQG